MAFSEPNGKSKSGNAFATSVFTASLEFIWGELTLVDDWSIL